MQVILMNNSSEKNKIGKSLSVVSTLAGALKDNSSVTHPTITVEMASPVGFNYCQIPEFGRYYFVDDVVVLAKNIMKLVLSVDVLESFKTQILAQNVIIDRNANTYDLYFPDDNLRTLVKTKTDIVNFSSGLLDNGEFILITAGG